MEQQSKFSYELRRYIKMIISIWPSLRAGLKNISQIPLSSQSILLPHRSYNSMSLQVFLSTIINDFHLFIMQHDVSVQDLQDYLYQILDLLSITEQITAVNNNVGGVKYMANQLIKVINQLQQDKVQTIEKFQKNVYNVVVQMGIAEVVQQPNNHDDEQGDSQSQNQQQQQQQIEIEMEDENWEDQQQQQQQKQQKTQQQLLKQKQLEDDGWVIVKKK